MRFKKRNKKIIRNIILVSSFLIILIFIYGILFKSPFEIIQKQYYDYPISECFIEYGAPECLGSNNKKNRLIPLFNPTNNEIDQILVSLDGKNYSLYSIESAHTSFLGIGTCQQNNITKEYSEMKIRWCCEDLCFESDLKPGGQTTDDLYEFYSK